MEKQETIAETMREFMASGPSATEFTSYKALNDAVGAVHGLAEGKCQALAGAKAWAWAKDEVTGKWREATEAEVEACKAKAATKAHGGPRSKVMGDEDRAALDAQIGALETVNNPALAPLLAGLQAQQVADDAARRGSLKDRLADCVAKLGIERAVHLLEEAVEAGAEAVEAGAEAEAVEAPEAI